MARTDDDDDDDAEPGRHDGSSRTRDGPPGFVEEEDEFELNEHGKSGGKEAYWFWPKRYFGTARRRCRPGALIYAIPTYRMRGGTRKDLSGRPRPPTDAGTSLAFATRRPPVSSCTLDPTQALAGWQAGRQTRGGEDSLAQS